MYESFFDLRDKPFNITPDPRYLYLADSHEEALSALLYGIREKKGLVTITGPVGVGKTTILFSFFERIDREADIAFFPGGITGNRVDFFRELCKQFRLPADSPSLFDLTRELKTFTASRLEQGRSVIVLVDEAQDLGVEELNNFRYMNNLETPSAKFLQIVLTGTEGLDDRLRDDNLLSLRQRVAIRCEIRPLDPASSVEYILHRLRVAGNTSGTLFTPGALWRVVNYAGGIPRRINVLCDNAMIIAFALKASHVDEACVTEALEGMEGKVRAGEVKEVVSRNEVEALLQGAVRRLDEKAGPEEAPVRFPETATPVEVEPRTDPDPGLPQPDGSFRDMEFPRKVSVLRDMEEAVPVRRRIGVVAGLLLAGLLLAGLVVFFLMRPDAPDEPAQVPQPEEVPAAREPVPPGEMFPAAGMDPSGTADVRNPGAPEGAPVNEVSPPAVTADIPVSQGEVPEEVPAAVPAGGGLAAVALERYGTLTLAILRDLRERNPEIRDWNRLGVSEEIRLDEEAAAAGKPVDFFSVQVISYRREENSLQAARRLCRQGVENVFVLSPDSDPEPGRRWFSCCVGLFPSAEEAAGWLDRMRSEGFDDAFITRIRGMRLSEILYPCAGGS